MSEHKHVMSRDEFRKAQRQQQTTATGNGGPTAETTQQSTSQQTAASHPSDEKVSHPLLTIAAILVGIYVAYKVIKFICYWVMGLLSGFFSWLIGVGEIVIGIVVIYWLVSTLSSKVDRSMDEQIDRYKRPWKHGYRQK